jgi:gliding motility-associated-like protein
MLARRIILLFMILPFYLKGVGQTCSIQPSTYKVCLGSSVVFAINTTGTIVKSSWTFGDGASDTLPNPPHIYSKPGIYTVTVIVEFANNVKCTATVSQPIRVFDLPKAGFDITGNDSICITHILCLQSTSTPGSSGAPIRKTSFLFGDGTPVINSPNPCHKYPKTGNFVLTLEVEDTNGCIARIEKPMWVFDSVNADITPFVTNCAPVRFLNTSNMSLANVKRFYWDFGDGTYDSVNFSLAQHLYTDRSKCPYKVVLYIESKFGCAAAKTVNVCPFATFNTSIQSDKHNSCFTGNVFNYTSSGNSFGSSYSWSAKLLGTATAILGGPGFTYTFRFNDCGDYVITLYMRNGNCDTTLNDTIHIMGPVSHIELDTMPGHKVVNSNLCTPDDTTYFVSPATYQSHHCSSSIKRIWDFGDLKCPQCTTDTKNGINVKSNCRWSVDSINVKHKYSDTGCYTVRLFLRDTISGCSDTDEKTVVINKPDLSALRIIGRHCLNELQKMDMSKVIPRCGADAFWFNVDTICNGDSLKSYIKIPLTGINFSYSHLCNGNKVVSAFILKNGNCYDTLYWPLTISKLNTRFDLVPGYGCPPLEVRAILQDSIQLTATRVIWEWEPGVKDTFDINGGIIHSATHIYTTPGVYTVNIQMFDTTSPSLNYKYTGCMFDSTFYIAVGFYNTFEPAPNVCAGTTIQFEDTVRYYHWPYNPNNPYSPHIWGTGTGESIFWDFGDGSSATGTRPSHLFPKAGKYTVKMIVTDSTGCTDTTIRIVAVSEIRADFGWKPSILVCGQIVQFSDSSVVKDSSGVSPPDRIISWDWDFGDYRIHSNLKNPAHPYFVYGKFIVKLKIKTLRGCVDSISKEIYIDGPQPKFEFITDTIGCVPYTIRLRNTSIGCQSNIIYMGDAANSSFPLGDSDTITFTYSKPGIYLIYLFGEANVLNPNTGSKVYCSSWFPEKNNPNAPLMRVIVLPRPGVSFNIPDTVCPNVYFNITNTSDSIYTTYYWDYGDSTYDIKYKPDANTGHSYKDTGVFTIKLAPRYTPGPKSRECPDSALKKITVIKNHAAFSLDTSSLPVVRFKNESVMSSKYTWDFGHPSTGKDNTSSLLNPEHDYLNDTGTFTICLTAENKYGCVDSVCHPVRNTNYRFLIIPNVFTINEDGINDAFDIKIHGNTYYDLKIFNRWGQAVYSSETDGEDNDGINWNGKLFNTGNDCPEGVYYVLFKYQFKGEGIKTYKGPVTLIRK